MPVAHRRRCPPRRLALQPIRQLAGNGGRQVAKQGQMGGRAIAPGRVLSPAQRLQHGRVRRAEQGG